MEEESTAVFYIGSVNSECFDFPGSSSGAGLWDGLRGVRGSLPG